MQELDQQKQIVLNFIRSQKLATLATADENGNPEAATVAISETDDLELIFGCYASARKYHNLLQNTNVAVVFSEGKISIQYEGRAIGIRGDDVKKYQDIHIAKHIGSAKHLSHPVERYFKIMPLWIKFMDHSAKPSLDFEIKF